MNGIHEVRGSIPLSSTSILNHVNTRRPFHDEHMRGLLRALNPPRRFQCMLYGLHYAFRDTTSV
jgi:hypothetical protein